MFNLFRRNCLYNESIEPHCAYLSLIHISEPTRPY